MKLIEPSVCCWKRGKKGLWTGISCVKCAIGTISGLMMFRCSKKGLLQAPQSWLFTQHQCQYLQPDVILRVALREDQSAIRQAKGCWIIGHSSPWKVSFIFSNLRAIKGVKVIVELKKALRAEMEKVAKKQIRQETEVLRKSVSRYRSDIAALKREHKALKRQLDQLAKSPAAAAPAAADESARQIRFAPTWLKKHRQKLGLTAADYGQLVGVHPITIYNWEQGKSKPRAAQLEALAKVRTLGKREAQRQLAE